jgi:hypothetical protein
MEIFFSIVAILSLVFCTLVIIDKTIFDSKIREIDNGMTGKEVQNVSGKKLEIIKIDGNTYYARIKSSMKFYRYRLVFFNGRLISKQRE